MMVIVETFQTDKLNPIATREMLPSEAHMWAYAMLKAHGKGDIRVWSPERDLFDGITYYWDDNGYEIRVHAPLP